MRSSFSTVPRYICRVGVLCQLLALLASCSLIFDEQSPGGQDEADLCLGQQRIYARGESTGNSSFEHIDYRQGTITFWTRVLEAAPEATQAVPLLDLGGIEVLATWPSGLEFRVLGQEGFTVESEPWTVGEDVFVSLRWDTQQPLSGSGSLQRHVEARVGQREFFHVDASFMPVFAADSELRLAPADGSFHVDQLVIYDRPLFVNNDVNVPSELFAMAESKEDGAHLVNGGFSALFASASPPTDGCEAYAAHGWSQVDSLLPGDFRFLDATDWVGAFSKSNEPVYGGGGISLTLSQELRTSIGVAPTGSYTLDLLTHGVGSTGRVLVAVSGVETQMFIGAIQGRGIGTRENPERLVLTFDVPANVRTAEVIIVSSGEGAEIHALSMRANLLESSGFEGDTLDEEVWIRNSITEPELVFLTENQYASLASLCIESDTSPEAVLQAPQALVDHEFYLFGGAFFWFDREAPGVSIANGSLFATGIPYEPNSKAGAATSTPLDWGLAGTVGRRFRDPGLNSRNDLIRFGGTKFGSDVAVRFCVDSAYVMPTRRIDGTVFAP